MNKPLEKWCPAYLREIYEATYSQANKPLSDYLCSQTQALKTKESAQKQAEILHRIGTLQDMERTWERLLNRSPKKVLPVSLEHVLVGAINGAIKNLLNSPIDKTPREKNKELGKIAEHVDELLKIMEGSKIAKEELSTIAQTYFHHKNVKYRQKNGELLNIDLDQWHPNISLRNIPLNASIEIYASEIDDPASWTQRSSNARLAWWVQETMGLDMFDLLQFYKDRLKPIQDNYQKNYWSARQQKIIDEVREIMINLFGAPCHEDIAAICSAILDKELGKGDVTKSNKKGRKNP